MYVCAFVYVYISILTVIYKQLRESGSGLCMLFTLDITIINNYYYSVSDFRSDEVKRFTSESAIVIVDSK